MSKKLTSDNIQLNDLKGNWIELQNPTASGDILQYNENWTRNLVAFYINLGNPNMPLNKGIFNGQDFGQGVNPISGKAQTGYDKVYAEIDGFKNDGYDNLEADVFRSNVVALKNAMAIKDPTQRKAMLSKITLHQKPIAYLTDHYVPVKNSDGTVKKDSNGVTVYQIDHAAPLSVVYYKPASDRDPYASVPLWRRRVVNGSGSSVTDNGVKISEHSKAIALLEAFVSYIRGVETVYYDPYAPTVDDVINSLVNENQYKLVKAPIYIDGVKLDNVKNLYLKDAGQLTKKAIHNYSYTSPSNHATSATRPASVAPKTAASTSARSTRVSSNATSAKSSSSSNAKK